MFNRNVVLMSALILNLFLNAGCFAVVIGAAAGAGGIAFIKGILTQNVDYDVKKVHEASLKAVKDLALNVSSDQLDVHASMIKGSYPDGKNFSIQLEALTERATNIMIRIGVFGDEERSRMILNAILKRL